MKRTLDDRLARITAAAIEATQQEIALAFDIKFGSPTERLIGELGLYARHLATYTCDDEEIGEVRPLRDLLADAALTLSIQAKLGTAALDASGKDEREARWAKWPQGDAGDAVDFACDHAKEPLFFLEDWRAGRADEWPEYMRWLSVQREGARAAIARTQEGSERCDQCGKQGGGHHPSCILNGTGPNIMSGYRDKGQGAGSDFSNRRCHGGRSRFSRNRTDGKDSPKKSDAVGENNDD